MSVKAHESKLNHQDDQIDAMCLIIYKKLHKINLSNLWIKKQQIQVKVPWLRG